MFVDDNRVTGGGIMCPGIGCQANAARMVPAAFHRRLEGNSPALITQHIRVSFAMNGLDHVKLGHVVSPKFSLPTPIMSRPNGSGWPISRRTAAHESWTRIAIREFDEVQAVLNLIVAEGTN